MEETINQVSQVSDGQTPETPAVLRGPMGRFLKGTKSLSPGRPRGNTAEQLRKRLQEALGTDRFDALVEELYTQATTAPETKDRREAAKYLLDQAMGRAPSAMHVTGPSETINPAEKRAQIMERYQELTGRN